MDAKITPSRLSGSLGAIPSKSDAHRKLVCSYLASSPTVLALPKTSADIDATISCLRALGADVSRSGDDVKVAPGRAADIPALDCGESGSTFRFLLPVAAATVGSASFTGRGRLPDRPIGELRRELERHGVSFTGERLPFAISGLMTGGNYSLPGNVSSQYITGLLLALPNLTESSEITLETRLESAPYVEMTLRTLGEFGITVEKTASGYKIPGGQTFCSPGRVEVAGDWSNAAFFLAAGALGGPVSVTGLGEPEGQGARAVADVLRRFGATVVGDNGAFTAARGDLRGVVIDAGEIPDLVPVLAVVASFADGETRITNAARLRLKESDRIATVAELVNSLGGRACEEPDGLTITGGGLRGGTVLSHNDHRIAMAAAVAAAYCRESVTIKGAECAAKSYPDFFRDFEALGGRVS